MAPLGERVFDELTGSRDSLGGDRVLFKDREAFDKKRQALLSDGPDALQVITGEQTASK